MTTAPNGDLYVIARLDGTTARSGRLYRWNNAASTWSLVAIFAQSDNRAVYPDDLQFDSAGNLHILWEWGIYPATTYRHQLSYLVYSPATGTFRDHAGAAVSVPVTTGTADIVQPLISGEAYGNDTGPAVQSAKLTLDGTSPKIVYRFRRATNFEVLYAYVSGSSWAREVVYNGGQTTAALDITWHPTDGKRVYYVTSSGTDRAFMATKPGAAWTTTSIAPGVPVERLAVERDGAGVDVLYLVDLTNLRLYYGRN